MKKPTLIFLHPTGPLVEYSVGRLHIADLNPEIKTNWNLSRIEMLRFGWRCIVAALSAPTITYEPDYSCAGGYHPAKSTR